VKIIGRLATILLGIVLIITSIILLVSLQKIDFIPNNYMTLIYVVIIVCTLIFGLILMLKAKNIIFKIFKGIVILTSIVFICIYGFAIYSLNNTLDVLENAFLMRAEVTNYYVVILKDSKYEEILSKHISQKTFK